jgi:hypothetical protein
MRRVHGTDLAQVLRAEGTLEPARVALLIGQLAGARGATPAYSNSQSVGIRSVAWPPSG